MKKGFFLMLGVIIACAFIPSGIMGNDVKTEVPPLEGLNNNLLDLKNELDHLKEENENH